MRVLPFLTYASSDKMTLVIKHFEDVLNFAKLDADHCQEDDSKIEAFVAMTGGIERNQIGNTMKDQMIELEIVQKCIRYLKENAPPMTSVLMRQDDAFWKEFLTKHSLRYILRALSGLATEHVPTQMLIAEDRCIQVLHQMEQVSSDEHVGSLAEAVLEGLKGCKEAEEKVKRAR